MRWERDKCSCGCASWDFGGRRGGLRTHGEWVCVGCGADPRRGRTRRRFRGVCVWWGCPRPGPGTLGAGSVCPGPPSGVSLPLCSRGSGASQVRAARGRAGRASVCAARALRSGRAAVPRGCRSRSRGRKRAGLQRGLTASAPARLPGRLPGRAGPGRRRGPGQVRVGGGTRRLPSPRPPARLRRGEGVARRSNCELSPAGGGTRGKVNQSSKSRGYALAGSLP